MLVLKWRIIENRLKLTQSLALKWSGSRCQVSVSSLVTFFLQLLKVNVDVLVFLTPLGVSQCECNLRMWHLCVPFSPLILACYNNTLPVIPAAVAHGWFSAPGCVFKTPANLFLLCYPQWISSFDVWLVMTPLPPICKWCGDLTCVCASSYVECFSVNNLKCCRTVKAMGGAPCATALPFVHK